MCILMYFERDAYVFICQMSHPQETDVYYIPTSTSWRPALFPEEAVAQRFDCNVVFIDADEQDTIAVLGQKKTRDHKSQLVTFIVIPHSKTYKLFSRKELALLWNSVNEGEL